MPPSPTPSPDQPPASRRLCIRGVTREGRAFRPADWAERLAGALGAFLLEPQARRAGACWSPLCVPRVVEGVKCVVVDPALARLQPLAWDFVTGFARDNALEAREVDLPADHEAPARG